uniref:SAM domain-containing protein n=1 Tax=Ditylenchus dipsaci TaxID=166011 RepID=A0A915CZA1_9BILA
MAQKTSTPTAVKLLIGCALLVAFIVFVAVVVLIVLFSNSSDAIPDPVLGGQNKQSGVAIGPDANGANGLADSARIRHKRRNRGGGGGRGGRGRSGGSERDRAESRDTGNPRDSDDDSESRSEKVKKVRKELNEWLPRQTKSSSSSAPSSSGQPPKKKFLEHQSSGSSHETELSVSTLSLQETEQEREWAFSQGREELTDFYAPLEDPFAEEEQEDQLPDKRAPRRAPCNVNPYKPDDLNIDKEPEFKVIKSHVSNIALTHADMDHILKTFYCSLKFNKAVAQFIAALKKENSNCVILTEEANNQFRVKRKGHISVNFIPAVQLFFNGEVLKGRAKVTSKCDLTNASKDRICVNPCHYHCKSTLAVEQNIPEEFFGCLYEVDSLVDETLSPFFFSRKFKAKEAEEESDSEVTDDEEYDATENDDEGDDEQDEQDVDAELNEACNDEDVEDAILETMVESSGCQTEEDRTSNEEVLAKIMEHLRESNPLSFWISKPPCFFLSADLDMQKHENAIEETKKVFPILSTELYGLRMSEIYTLRIFYEGLCRWANGGIKMRLANRLKVTTVAAQRENESKSLELLKMVKELFVLRMKSMMGQDVINVVATRATMISAGLATGHFAEFLFKDSPDSAAVKNVLNFDVWTTKLNDYLHYIQWDAQIDKRVSKDFRMRTSISEAEKKVPGKLDHLMDTRAAMTIANMMLTTALGLQMLEDPHKSKSQMEKFIYPLCIPDLHYIFELHPARTFAEFQDVVYLLIGTIGVRKSSFLESYTSGSKGIRWGDIRLRRAKYTTTSEDEEDQEVRSLEKGIWYSEITIRHWKTMPNESAVAKFHIIETRNKYCPLRWILIFGIMVGAFPRDSKLDGDNTNIKCTTAAKDLYVFRKTKDGSFIENMPMSESHCRVLFAKVADKLSLPRWMISSKSMRMGSACNSVIQALLLNPRLSWTEIMGLLRFNYNWKSSTIRVYFTFWSNSMERCIEIFQNCGDPEAQISDFFPYAHRLRLDKEAYVNERSLIVETIADYLSPYWRQTSKKRIEKLKHLLVRARTYTNRNCQDSKKIVDESIDRTYAKKKRLADVLNFVALKNAEDDLKEKYIVPDINSKLPSIERMNLRHPVLVTTNLSILARNRFSFAGYDDDHNDTVVCPVISCNARIKDDKGFTEHFLHHELTVETKCPHCCFVAKSTATTTIKQLYESYRQHWVRYHRFTTACFVCRIWAPVSVYTPKTRCLTDAKHPVRLLTYCSMKYDVGKVTPIKPVSMLKPLTRDAQPLSSHRERREETTKKVVKSIDMWSINEVADFFATFGGETARQTVLEEELNGEALEVLANQSNFDELLRDTFKLKLGPRTLLQKKLKDLICENQSKRA